MRKESFEIEGKRYVTTKVMAGFWDVSQRTVTEYCRDCLVIGAFKDSSNRYMIPSDAKKPLSKNVIEKVLWLVVQLKNNSSYQIDYSSLGVTTNDIEWAFKYLAALSFFEPISQECPVSEIPYKAQLTDKGFALIQNPAKKDRKSLDTAAIIELLPALVKTASYAVDILAQIGT